jgi:hypothetical protein
VCFRSAVCLPEVRVGDDSCRTILRSEVGEGDESLDFQLGTADRHERPGLFIAVEALCTLARANLNQLGHVQQVVVTVR